MGPASPVVVGLFVLSALTTIAASGRIHPRMGGIVSATFNAFANGYLRG